MWQPQIGVYLGKQPEEGFIGFITNQQSLANGENFYLVVSFPFGVNQEKGHQIIVSIKEEFVIQKISTLAQLDHFIDQIIKQHNFPAIFSLAVLVLTKEGIAYLKTNGQGCIYLKRDNRLVKIIEGNHSASGYIKKDDSFLITTVDLIKVVDEGRLKKLIDDYSPNKFVEELNNYLINQDNQGLIAGLIKFYYLVKEEESFETEKKPEKTKTNSFFSQILESYQKYRFQLGNKKIITFIITLIIIIILIWSVILGVKRKEEVFRRQKIYAVKELIVQKLDQAEEVAYLNLERSKALIQESKDEIELLKKELKIKDNKNKEIVDLERLIKEKENKIIRKEEKEPIEFYDLTVDEKNASGFKLALSEETMAIVDKNQGVIYSLSLEKKSLDKLTDQKIKKSTMIANNKDEMFFYVEKEGVYRINKDSDKAEKVIDFDKDWGKIIDIKIYNNNIYLLDNKNNQIYKYLRAEKGYSEKTNYIKSGSFNFQDANSMMIDSSIYVGLSNSIIKLTLGVEDEFANDLPKESINFNKIYTDKETEKVYAWDKTQGKIYVLTKNGRYERQIDSSILKKITDFVVYNNSAYLLLKEKIFKIDLD